MQMKLYNKNKKVDNGYAPGISSSLGCALIWGILPIYWKALIPIDSRIIIIYRIFTVCVFSIVLARMNYSWDRIFAPLRDRSTRLKYFAAGFIITFNWSTYIWAVNAGYVVQCSIGYYIEPLMVCVFGIVLFKEKLTTYKFIAMMLAGVSVVIILIHFGQLPKIALMLAITFSIYSAIKKTAEQPPLISLVYETLFFAPIALVAIIYLESAGKGAWGTGDTYQYFLMWLSGLFTVIPLALFAFAATRISMFTLGLITYISPTIQLVLGVFVFNEDFDVVQFAAFAIIWIGLVFFSFGEFKEARSNQVVRINKNT